MQVQELQRKLPNWQLQMRLFAAGQQLLAKHRYQFPSDWLHFDTVEVRCTVIQVFEHACNVLSLFFHYYQTYFFSWLVNINYFYFFWLAFFFSFCFSFCCSTRPTVYQQAEWNAFNDLLARKSAAIKSQIASLQTKIAAESHIIDEQISRFLEDWG